MKKGTVVSLEGVNLRKTLGRWLMAGLFLALCSTATAADEVDYTRQIKPLLIEHCSQCHGPKKQENGLRLDTAAAARQGGDSGPAITPQKASESLLLKAVLGQSDEISKMPPEGPGLTAEQIALLTRWIDAGASAPSDEQPLPSPAANHWAFKPPTRVPPPAVRLATWPQQALDCFLLAKLEASEIAPSPAAPSATLLRRVYLDLIGLPPTLAETATFEQDQRPDAYERVVDRLLASPHHGERFARHWLDLARYADSNGYTRDFPRQIWRYREWVIDAINQGLPFDQFTIEQLAGDLLPDASPLQMVATGFHRNTLINEEGGTDPEQFRVEAVADRVATTGSVWLGLTLGCARCHTHKYDPVSQTEYYQFFALLNNCDEPTLEVPSNVQRFLGEPQRREQLRAKAKELAAELEQQRPEFELAQQAWEKTVTPQQRARLPGPVQVAYDMPFADRNPANKKLVEEYYQETEEARQAFPQVAEIQRLKKEEPKIPSTMILRERKQPRETFVHKRGDFLNHGAKVQGGVPAILPPITKQAAAPSRLDLARWLVTRENPLTPRVTVNREWLLFFGRGLVETEDDFGTQGSLPSHPELLDYLARELADGSWDLKKIRRQIVTSAAYRQSSHSRGDLAEKDPQNRLLARQSRLRLEAEIVRDVALFSAGLLTETLGGPSVFPPQPDGVYDFTQDPKNWQPTTGADRYRRGLYTHFWRSAPYPALMVFDSPGGNVTCTRRIRSNTPLQALTIANDTQFIECAQALARRVLAEAPAEQDARVQFAFQLTLCRQPTSRERQTLTELAEKELSALAQDPARATALVPQESQSLPAEEQATLSAWVSLCRVLLNLDEAITRE